MIQLSKQEMEEAKKALIYRMTANKVREKNHWKKRVLCIDFDGVLHSYTSGWQGATHIPDEPVPGAIEWLKELLNPSFASVLQSPDFEVNISSSRSRYLFGRFAMKSWLRVHGLSTIEVKSIRFPLFKPDAYIFIDDRCITFSGVFPTSDALLCFKPWNNI